LSCRGLCLFLLLVSCAAPADEQPLDEVRVIGRRVANLQPAGSYASLATRLRFDPQTELQPRGLPEGQADVTVEGGIFENTGFAVGAATIMDPQTGHYSAGLPIDPRFLTPPRVRTGIDNAVLGFNSNVATLVYSLAAVSAGGDILLGGGNDSLGYGSLRQAWARSGIGGRVSAMALSAAYSKGDGTLANGDHEFSRYNLHLQRRQGNTQTDLLLAYQDKFFGWPGAYTGFASLAETDHTKTRLLLLNHRRESADGWAVFSAYYRGLVDNYDFDRTTKESGTPGSFDHKTRVWAAAVQGGWRGGRIDWRFGGQLTADRLLRSTDLTGGDFNARRYLKFTLVPTIDLARSTTRVIRLRAGASLDGSNRDGSAVSPLIGLSMRSSSSSGSTRVALEYAATSQLPGYTALKSPPAGLFGGNSDLGRERARQLSFTASRETPVWNALATLFYRKDDNLVDWTYSTGAPFARQANAVDIDVFGAEVITARNWQTLHAVAAYTWLHKNADYGMSLVDASFYALNFARHRATLSLRWDMTAQVELRLDNEYRVQRDNPLRQHGERAYFGALSLAWNPPPVGGLVITLAVDNLSDSHYQYYPGTPAVGRQLSLSGAYRW
jgi:hypothetical protein